MSADLICNLSFCETKTQKTGGVLYYSLLSVLSAVFCILVNGQMSPAYSEQQLMFTEIWLLLFLLSSDK